MSLPLWYIGLSGGYAVIGCGSQLVAVEEYVVDDLMLLQCMG